MGDVARRIHTINNYECMFQNRWMYAVFSSKSTTTAKKLIEGPLVESEPSSAH